MSGKSVKDLFITLSYCTEEIEALENKQNIIIDELYEKLKKFKFSKKQIKDAIVSGDRIRLIGKRMIGQDEFENYDESYTYKQLK